MADIYTDGSYFANKPTWDIEDSPWKAEQIKKILMKNDLNPKTICDVGCGAGGIINELYQTYSDSIQYKGFDISPHAYQLCKKNDNERVSFYNIDFLDVDGEYCDLILLIDVIEHIEDMYSFLRTIKGKGLFKLFHIPLEFNSVRPIKHSTLLTSRQNSGHLHFFTKELALELLRTEGYEIIDFFYTPGFKLKRDPSIINRILTIPQYFSFRFDSDLGVRIFGGVSLLVLTR